MKRNYRVIIEQDYDYQLEGCDGKPLPESEEVYKNNAYMKDGKPIPYDEYLEYYGNPGRHVILMARVEKSCGECGAWRTVESLGGIDFMDDDKEAYQTGTFTPEEALTLGQYLAMEVKELLEEAGWKA